MNADFTAMLMGVGIPLEPLFRQDLLARALFALSLQEYSLQVVTDNERDCA